MSIERAVHRLTAEIADWFELDAGKLRVGDRVVLVNGRVAVENGNVVEGVGREHGYGRFLKAGETNRAARHPAYR